MYPRKATVQSLSKQRKLSSPRWYQVLRRTYQFLSWMITSAQWRHSATPSVEQYRQIPHLKMPPSIKASKLCNENNLIKFLKMLRMTWRSNRSKKRPWAQTRELSKQVRRRRLPTCKLRSHLPRSSRSSIWKRKMLRQRAWIQKTWSHKERSTHRGKKKQVGLLQLKKAKSISSLYTGIQRAQATIPTINQTRIWEL